MCVCVCVDESLLKLPLAGSPPLILLCEFLVCSQWGLKGGEREREVVFYRQSSAVLDVESVLLGEGFGIKCQCSWWWVGGGLFEIEIFDSLCGKRGAKVYAELVYRNNILELRDTA